MGGLIGFVQLNNNNMDIFNCITNGSYKGASVSGMIGKLYADYSYLDFSNCKFSRTISAFFEN